MTSVDNRSLKIRILAAAVGLAVVGLSAALVQPTEPERSRVYEFSGHSMGTTYTGKVVDVASPAAGERARAIVEAELELVERTMSTYDSDSELSRFNRHRSTQPFRMSRTTLEVFTLAREVSELSGGAFDITVGPLVAAWGFGATDRIPAPPTARERAAARRRVGFRMVGIDLRASTLTKHRVDIACDLSAIAKGYAVDRAIEALQANGFSDALVEVGGDLRAAGRRPGGGPWRLAIEAPVSRRGSVQRLVQLSGEALATSGDYRNYYEVDGQRFSHFIDPRSGAPSKGDLASVSVVHRSAAMADALATALSVLGADEGVLLAEKRDLAAFFLIREDGVLRELATTGFGARLSDGATAPVPAVVGGY